jgi:hypothetical protein
LSFCEEIVNDDIELSSVLVPPCVEIETDDVNVFAPLIVMETVEVDDGDRTSIIQRVNVLKYLSTIVL